MKHIPDDVLTAFYEASGLFAKIIDTPADEALRSGFELICNDAPVRELFSDVYENLNIDEILITGIKRARLFGGCIVVMLIDDGRGVDEPLNLKTAIAIDGIKLYDRSLIEFEEADGSEPERYSVYSKYGSFTVHKSRCLIFKNGVLPERGGNSIYKYWGVPEYLRIYDAVKDVEVSHGYIPEILNRSVQAIYKAKGLRELVSTEEGELILLQRIQALDMARSMMNSIIIDADGEDYTFKSVQLLGVADAIEKGINFLSAVSSIPKAFLYNEKLGPLSKTNRTAIENWYNLIERIQQKMLKNNLYHLATIILHIGKNTRTISHIPTMRINFRSLWQESEPERVTATLMRAQAQLEQAKTMSTYHQMGAVTPDEVRKIIERKGS